MKYPLMARATRNPCSEDAEIPSNLPRSYHEMIEDHTIRSRLTELEQDPAKLRQAAFSVIDRGQEDPSTQIIGTALALLTMTRAIDVDLSQLLNQCERRLDDSDGAFVYVYRAIEEYTKNEIRRA